MTQANDHVYMAIDLKSFYASVECRAHHLDPLDTNLVVADAERTDKTICLAVSPALKQFGVPGRPRLYEVRQRVSSINRHRSLHNHDKRHIRLKSYYRSQLIKNSNLKVDFKIVKPRMHYYMEKSAEVYGIYLRFIKPENIHVYSIDEVMMDVTEYLNDHKVTAHSLAKQIIREVQSETGITATAGIGTNLYLAKVAMDIVAKRIPADADGVRIAQMNEFQYRKYLWAHTPLTDFWRIGRGYSKRLAKLGLRTMGDIARCSLGSLTDERNEEILYKEFGKNAELLIDHAWGFESATIQDIKNYHSDDHGIYSSQVLATPHTFKKGRLAISGMIDSLALDLVKQHSVSKNFGLIINYDPQSFQYAPNYNGSVSTDFYGRKTPKADHVNVTLETATSSNNELREVYKVLYEQCANHNLLIRRITLTANNLVDEQVAQNTAQFKQTDLFENTEQEIIHEKNADAKRRRDHKLQETILKLQKISNNKNIVLRLSDIEKGSTTRERNNSIGGHRA